MMFYLTLRAPIFVVERVINCVAFPRRKNLVRFIFRIKNRELKIATTQESFFDVEKIE